MNIEKNLQHIQQSIITAQKDFRRENADIQLLAVSKTKPVAAIMAAYQAGQSHFGENYVQEALAKIHALKDYPLTWHFIGKIQSNKTKSIAEYFTWVHSLDSIKIAKRLNEQRLQTQPPLNVLIAINIDEEKNKTGILLKDIKTFADDLLAFKNLKLRGLMCIPKVRTEFTKQRLPFQKCRQALEDLNKQGFALDTLSMGMSNDFRAAIAEGATIIRIGSAIFGSRNKIPRRLRRGILS